MREKYAFDVEVFPNFFCVSFISVDKSDVKTFVIYEHQNDLKEMLEFLKRDLFLVSYNGISYDMPVIRFIKGYKGSPADLNKKIFELSSKLVDDAYRDDRVIRGLRYPHIKDYVHQDLMRMMNFLKTGVGLKQCSVNLKWKRVQDLPFKYNHTVFPAEVETIVDYNINDVLITLELYNQKDVTEARELREGLVTEFGTRILSAAKSEMANIMLEALYAKETGFPKEAFMEGRTSRAFVDFSDVIFKEIFFTTPELQKFLQEMKTVGVSYFSKYAFEKELIFRDNVFNIGVGGLHTNEGASKYISTPEQKIISADVASFYPSIMCEYGVKPQHLDAKFLTILSKIKTERLEAKKAGNKTKAESYKILINSVFGKTNYPGFWLYDPLAFLRVTVNGQLFLIMLIEMLEESGIRVISANTDGVECLVPEDKKETFSKITTDWQKYTRFELEFEEYTHYIKRDVNNYVAITARGKVKEKGAFVRTISLEKGYHMPVVAKALYAYFIDSIPVRQYLESNKDIMDFCISQKSASDFQIELHKNSGVEKLQKTNRFYISTNGGSLLKRKLTSAKNSTTGLYVGKMVVILNDYDETVPFEDYAVNLNFYEQEVMKIVDGVEPRQFSLFDIKTVGRGHLNKMLAPQTRVEMADKARDKNSLNKLGEKQLAKRLTEILADNEVISGINPRFVIVKGFNPKTQGAELYCPAKGTQSIIRVDKKVYKNTPFFSGQILYCDRFDKVEGEHILAKYQIVKKFENAGEQII